MRASSCSKIQGVAADADSTGCLVSVLDHLAEQDPAFPVPRLFPTLRGEAIGRFSREQTDYAVCMVSFISGRLLTESAPTPELLRGVGTTLARLDLNLRGFFHPSLSRRLAWDVRNLPELAAFGHYIESAALREAVAAVSEALRACLPRLRGLRSQAIHGDCHAANLVVDEDGQSICGILDFGDMIHAPLIFEPAIAMSELLTEAVAPQPRSLPCCAAMHRARLFERRKWNCSTTSSPRGMPSLCWCMPGAVATIATAPAHWMRRRCTASARWSTC